VPHPWQLHRQGWDSTRSTSLPLVVALNEALNESALKAARLYKLWKNTRIVLFGGRAGLQRLLKKSLWLHLRISVGLQPHKKAGKLKGL